MSWNLSVSAIPVDQVKEKLDEAVAKQLELASYDSFDDDVQAQLDTVAKVAADLVGNFFGDVKKISVISYGHQSRGPTDSNTVTVSISEYDEPLKVESS